MKTITIMLVLIILLASHSLPAQTHIGLTAGASFANVTMKAEGISISPKANTGITGGIFVDVPLSTGFSFQPALNFVQKGFKTTDETSSDKLILNYLEAPLNFVYHNSGFFIGAGPSVSYGLSGKEKYVDKEDASQSENTKITFGSGEEEIKKIEFGVNALAGYRTSGGFMFSVNYNLGLTDIQNTDEDDLFGIGTVKNKYFALKIGYILNSTKRK